MKAGKEAGKEERMKRKEETRAYQEGKNSREKEGR